MLNVNHRKWARFKVDVHYESAYYGSSRLISIQLLGHGPVYCTLLSDKLKFNYIIFLFPFEFPCKFLLILYFDASFDIFSHSYLVFTTMPYFWMGAKYITSIIYN